MEVVGLGVVVSSVVVELEDTSAQVKPSTDGNDIRVWICRA